MKFIMWRELLRRRSARLLFLLFVLLLVIQYSLNVFGYFSRSLPELVMDRVKQMGLVDYSEDDAIPVIFGSGYVFSTADGSVRASGFTPDLSNASAANGKRIVVWINEESRCKYWATSLKKFSLHCVALWVWKNF